MLLGLFDLLYLFVRRFWGIAASTSPLLLVGVMFVIMGFQAVLMGLIAELLARTYHESQSKPTYTIRAILGKK
jgi:Tfp pilus assembly protein PilO